MIDIFWLEDQFHPTWLQGAHGDPDAENLTSLTKMLAGLTGARVFVQRDVDKPHETWQLVDGGVRLAPRPNDFAPRIAILDLRMSASDEPAPDGTPPEISRHWEELVDYGGFRFAICEERRLLRSCALLAYLSASSTDKAIAKLLPLRGVGMENQVGPELLFRKNNSESCLELQRRIRAVAEMPSHLHFPRALEGLVEISSRLSMGTLIVGESGTGKEGVAASIARRYRARHPHLPPCESVNCGAFVEGGLGHSEIFGFVGATATGTASRLGKLLHCCGRTGVRFGMNNTSQEDFEEALRTLHRFDHKPLLKREADGSWTAEEVPPGSVHGLLFLDEFGDLSSEMQVRLLRALDPRTAEIQPGGYPGVVRGLRFKVIAATSDPAVAALAGRRLRPRQEARFRVREDLYFRLAGLTIQLQSLLGLSDEDLAASIKELVRRRGDAGVGWAPEAEDALVDHVLKLKGIPGVAFGEFRQVTEWISLVNCLAETAADRGLPFVAGRSVTRETVEDVLRMTAVREILTPRMAEGAAPVATSTSPGDKRRKAFAALPSTIQVLIPAGWEEGGNWTDDFFGRLVKAERAGWLFQELSDGAEGRALANRLCVVLDESASGPASDWKRKFQDRIRKHLNRNGPVGPSAEGSDGAEPTLRRRRS